MKGPSMCPCYIVKNPIKFKLFPVMKENGMMATGLPAHGGAYDNALSPRAEA